MPPGPEARYRRFVTDDRPEMRLALTYVPAAQRPAVQAILAVDDRLGAIVRTTREPLLGQMRLTWWHDALRRLDEAPPPAEPLLSQLAASVLPAGVVGAALAPIVDGWEALLEQPLGKDAVRRHGDRGRAMFAAMGTATGTVDDPLEEAGAGWALADLSRHLTHAEAARCAAELALPLLDRALSLRWSRAGRALGALAHLARLDLTRPDLLPGSPRRVARMLRHRLTGR